ncbi:MAG: NAD(P)H-hydrate epimerase, partial [Deltaproteobacteria bacterium]|nr:NAD(P)H-hydrate epimerase [Deltaproteobacteria bacterium]
MILVTAAEMQEMDRQAIEKHSIPGLELMETAGQGATITLLSLFAEQAEEGVSIVCGKGNNGGDGFVIARELAAKDFNVTVYLLAKTEAVQGDAAVNLKRLAALKVPVIEVPDEDSFSKVKAGILRSGLLVDAILGTGLTSDVRGFFKVVIDFINTTGIPVFAVDIPSGLNSDT